MVPETASPRALGEINVINNLTSTSTTDALSANMGRVLKASIDAIPHEIATEEEIDAIFA